MENLQLRVIANDIQKGFVVQVSDSAGAAVQDAAVAFRLPDSGPTGTFTDGTHSAVVYTGADGRAYVTGIHWNDIAGPVAIRITATKGILHAGILFEQTLTGNALLLKPAQPAVSQPVAKTLPPSAEIAAPHPTSTQIATPPKAEPSVSITSASPGDSVHHGGKAKWLILAAVIAGAGAGVAMAGKGKSNSASSGNTSALSIGSPSVGIGHP